jgi:hypothetical protein
LDVELAITDSATTHLDLAISLPGVADARIFDWCAPNLPPITRTNIAAAKRSPQLPAVEAAEP